MNILHIISSSGFYGAERVVLNLASYLKNDGQESYLICLKNSSRPTPELHIKAREKDIFSQVFTCCTKFDLGTVFKIHKFIKEHKIDVIHTHGYKSNLYGLIAAKISRTPIVATLHLWTAETRKDRFYEWFDSLIVNKMDLLVPVSVVIEKELKELRIAKSKIKYIPNAIDVDQFNPANNAHSLRKKLNIVDSFVIGVVGRLVKQKGHTYLLDAFKDIAARNKNTKLLIVGDGPLRGELEQACQTFGITDQVIFTGALNNMVALYKSIDVFVLPSLDEGLPMVLLEAMSMALPVVATNVGGIPNVLDANDGIMINPRSKDELRDAMLKITENVSLREELGKNARNKIRTQFSIKHCAKEYQTTYESIAKK